MKIILIKTLVLVCSLAITAKAKIKVACIGDSITQGIGVADRKLNSYPMQLQRLLGDGYVIKNFGISGHTMLTKGDAPYTKNQAYQKSLNFQPNIVIIKLGTNDSKPQNWKHGKEFYADAKALVESYEKLASKPRVILCKPVPVFKLKWGINPGIVRNKIGKQLEKLAIDKKLELIDLHLPLINRPELVPDLVHPNAGGAEVMARHLHRTLSIPTESFQLDLKATSTFHGYPVYSENKDGIQIQVAIPRQVAKGKPWIWRARFWDHQPQTDIQLLELGFHVVYCDVGNLFGAPSAVARWNKCYTRMQALGLNPKAVLEGMSRGGLIIHNWAVANPEKVAGIIGDNCVMDFKSWPGGLGKGSGANSAWITCKKAYGFKSDDEAKAYKLNPIDTIETLTNNNIPLLYLIGAKDKIVPANENSQLASQKIDGYKHLKIINKPDAGHHPHSLPNPQPITEFALQCYGLLAKKVPSQPQALPTQSK